jgi:hypothetical protein
VSTHRARPLICAALLIGTLLVAACGGGGGSSGGGGVPPGPTPTPTATPLPTPTPKPTPTPTPCPTANGNPAIEPVILGCSNSFPTVNLPGGGQAGGTITFPLGSSPSSGVLITLKTGATSPPQYPTAIPPGFMGAGAVAIAPWLTYSLNQTLTTPPSSGIALNILHGPIPQGVTYFGVYDLTQNPNKPIDTTCVLITPSLGARTSHVRLTAKHARRGARARPNITIPANDRNYLGLFLAQQVGPSDGSPDPIDPAGSGKNPFVIPPLGPPSTGFSGTIGYPSNNAPSGATMSLESINVNNVFTSTCAAPTPPFGTPILFVGMQTSQSPLIFQSGTETTVIQSSTLVTGASYSLVAYDVPASGGGTQIGQTDVAQAQGGGVTFLHSPLNGYTFQNVNNDIIVFELIQD